jgi:hypothetical protein
MASSSLSIVLELEVSEIGQATATKDAARTDPADGARQSDLGRKTDY